jgi:hypothetical protein
MAKAALAMIGRAIPPGTKTYRSFEFVFWLNRGASAANTIVALTAFAEKVTDVIRDFGPRVLQTSPNEPSPNSHALNFVGTAPNG